MANARRQNGEWATKYQETVTNMSTIDDGCIDQDRLECTTVTKKPWSLAGFTQYAFISCSLEIKQESLNIRVQEYKAQVGHVALPYFMPASSGTSGLQGHHSEAEKEEPHRILSTLTLK